MRNCSKKADTCKYFEKHENMKNSENKANLYANRGNWLKM